MCSGNRTLNVSNLYSRKKNQKKISQKQEPARMYLQKTCIQRRRELSRPDKVLAVLKKVELDQFSPQKRKFMELFVLMMKEINDIFFKNWTLATSM